MKIANFSDRKWFYILLSVCLATIFWLYVREAEDPAQDSYIRGIPVILTGENVLEDQGLTVKAISQETIDLEINAPLSVIHKLRNTNMSVSLNVTNLSAAGDYSLTYSIVYPENVSKDDILVNDRSTYRITVTVDKLNSNTFEIEPRLQGSVAEGYQAGKWSISQESVVISGSADQVNQVAKVEAVLTGENLTKRVASDVPLTLLDAEGNVLTDLDVKLSIDSVYVALPIVVVKTIPLTVNLIGGGGVDVDDTKNYTVDSFPKTITVSGEEADMEALTEISLGSIDLAKVLGTSSFNFPINLDTSLENVSGITQAIVTISINNLSTKTFEAENIDLIHIPDGRDAEAITKMLPVIVRGEEEALETLDQSQISVVADLSEVTTIGSCTVPVKVYLNASEKVGVIGEYSIVVKIT